MGNFGSVQGNCKELGGLREPQLRLRVWPVLSDTSCVVESRWASHALPDIWDKLPAALFSCAVGGVQVWSEAQRRGRLH